MSLFASHSVPVPYRHAPGGRPFPAIEITIHGPTGIESTFAHIDTGADYCLFDGGRCPHLGIDLYAGKRMRFRTASGPTGEFYLHRVVVEFLGRRVEATFAFSTHSLHHELAGRNGFLEHVQLGLRERHQLVFIELEP